MKIEENNEIIKTINILLIQGSQKIKEKEQKTQVGQKVTKDHGYKSK